MYDQPIEQDEKEHKKLKENYLNPDSEFNFMHTDKIEIQLMTCSGVLEDFDVISPVKLNKHNAIIPADERKFIIFQSLDNKKKRSYMTAKQAKDEGSYQITKTQHIDNSKLSVIHLIKNYDKQSKEETKIEISKKKRSSDEPFNILVEKNIRNTSENNASQKFKKKNFVKRIVSRNDNVIKTEIFQQD